MKHSILRAMMALVVLAFTIPALADIPSPPKRDTSNSSSSGEKPRLVIRADSGVSEARLQIPRRMLKQLTGSGETESSSSRLYVIIASVLGSLLIAVGGILMFRYNRRTNRAKATIAAAIIFIAASAIFATADVARPPVRRPSDAGTLTQALAINEYLSGNVAVEVVEQGDQITLIVPKN